MLILSLYECINLQEDFKDLIKPLNTPQTQKMTGRDPHKKCCESIV